MSSTRHLKCYKDERKTFVVRTKNLAEIIIALNSIWHFKWWGDEAECFVVNDKAKGISENYRRFLRRFNTLNVANIEQNYRSGRWQTTMGET